MAPDGAMAVRALAPPMAMSFRRGRDFAAGVGADTGRYLDCGDSDRSGVAASRPHAKCFSASLRVSLERQERFATT